MNTVTPPQLVTSGSGNVTPPAAISWRNSASVCKFSPAAIGSPPSRTIRTWPGTSSGLVGSSSHTGSHSASARAARMRAHGPYALDVLAQRRSADLQLDRAEAAREVVVGLSQQRVDRQVEIDAAGVARHARIEPTQHAPERAFLATRAQVPQRDIDGRHRQRLGAPAAAVVQRPPHGL